MGIEIRGKSADTGRRRRNDLIQGEGVTVVDGRRRRYRGGGVVKGPHLADGG